ncbi:MAG: hypothetical protein K6G03_12210 [Lachnospiraceae bacterium]|nr:hypothetical protein [Lachnospiraceae bacterium]
MKKGNYGYINHMKLITGMISAAAFIAAAIVYFTGLHLFPDERLMVGIFTILICIPAAVSLVKFIMFVRFREGEPEIHERTEKIRGNIPVFYDAVITTNDKSYGVNVFAAFDNNLLGFSSYDKVDIPKLEKHIDDIFRLNKYKELNIKVFNDADKFFERLGSLASRCEKADTKDLAVLHLIGRISL